MTRQQTQQDLEHINLLAIFHYVLAGVLGLSGCVPIIHFTVGVLMVTDTPKTAGGPPLAAVGVLFIAVASVLILMFWAMAVCTVLAGRYLHRQQHYSFCLLVAGVLCAFMPRGT